jgi:hypothetical protein
MTAKEAWTQYWTTAPINLNRENHEIEVKRAFYAGMILMLTEQLFNSPTILDELETFIKQTISEETNHEPS